MDFQRKVMSQSVMMAMMCLAGSSEAQVTVSDDFTQGANQSPWTVSGAACLTAAASPLPSGITKLATGAIPTCSTSGQLGGYGDTVYPGGYMAAGRNDPGGNGALRLTNAVGSVAGSIIYNSVFPSNAGISITFTAVSYDGNSYAGGGETNGADGLSFFLLDAGVSPTAIGQYGGSLGYSCAQGKGGGATGGYIGLGIDEYGNFLNSGDNTATGVANTTGNYGQFQGNRIGVRGAGIVNWQQLTSTYPTYYPSSLNSTQQQTAVETTCSTGVVWNYSNYNSPTPVPACYTFAQLNALYPSYYPATLSASDQAAAVSKSCSTGNVWDYSYSNTAPDYSTSGNPYNLGQCLSYAQLEAINSSYYPASQASTTKGANAVANTCSTGKLYKWSSSSSSFTQTSSSVSVPTAVPLSLQVPDYGVIQYLNASNQTVPASAVLSVPIATESAGPRNAAGTYTGATEYTYKLTLTSNGLLSLTYTSTAGTSGTVASLWPIFASNGTLPANFKFGFAASTGGGTNIHEITCFQAAPAEDTDSSAAVNAVQAGQVKTNTAVYLAYYHTHNWWGQLTSTSLTYNSTTGQIVPSTTANWDASCVLTGDQSGTTLPGANCGATSSTSDTATSPSSRVMLTYDSVGNTGLPFEWSSLTGAEQSLLNDDSLGQKRVAYLRGDRTNEYTASNLTAPFRARTSVLGDIVNSSPLWVGGPSEYMPSGAWSDYLYPTAAMPESTNTYGSFQSAYSTRLNVVYAGANDGFVHGFEAGSYVSSTGGVTTPGPSTTNNGAEVIAFMPAAVLSTIHNTSNLTMDYSNPSYGHNYSVDATPGEGDLYYKNAWHSWLVGGLGAGGSSIYALDITNPANFAESNASSLVIGEWSNASGSLGSHLGSTYGIPQIGRFHSGNWGFYFGNGYNSASGVGGVFIGQVSQTTGAVSFTFLSLPSSVTGANGIFNVTGVDLDGDGIIDYIYAGDLQGHVWRWDVTGNSTTAWPTSTPILLFQTASGQPITTQIQPVAVPNSSGFQRLIIAFGTGEQIQTGQNPNSNTYAQGQQSLYGIWDGNMASWNGNSLTSDANKYDPYPSSITVSPSTTATNIVQPFTVPIANLMAQTTTSGSYTASGVVTYYRTISSTTAPCWADGLTSCPNGGTYPQYGWTYNFPTVTGVLNPEQVIANPILSQGTFIVNSYIASATQACTAANPTGWTTSLNPATGGGFPASFFVNSQGVVESAVQTGATGSPSIVSTSAGNFVITNTSNSNGDSTGGVVGAGSIYGGAGNFQNQGSFRLNWSEVR
ncbi:MAG: PilC/PilY family type IV pilus protein [Burkholderiaceae bacterium]|nr:PilC/PilY family type IV pilus protein [Burkholderiaceae bacterium]